MNNFKLVTPNAPHKAAAIEFMQEFLDNQSALRGTGGLENYLDNYEGWLEKLEAERNREIDEDGVPNGTYFFIGDDDTESERIVGICNINFALNQKLWEYKHHIGYSIRPSDRGHHYARTMLYCICCICFKHDLRVIIVACDEKNVASLNTIRRMGATEIARYDEPARSRIVRKFALDTASARNCHMVIYDQFLAAEFKKYRLNGGDIDP